MSVSAIGSSLNTASLATLLGTGSTSSTSSSATSAATSAGDAVTVDLSAVAKAAASGDASSKAGALRQLKADLASEETSLLNSLVTGSSSTDDAATAGNELLSTIYGSSGLGSLSSQSAGTTGTTIDTTA